MKKLLITFVLLTAFITACNNKTIRQETNTTPVITSTPDLKPSPSPAAAQALKLSDYFPFEKDIHLKYMGTGNEYAPFDTYVDYVKDNLMQIRNINGGTTSVIIYKLKDGALRKVYTKGETYYKYDYTALENNDEIIIKEPIETGNSWVLGDNSTRSITATDAKIKVPAGEFSTIEVTTQSKDSTTKEYYAKGLGLIKREFKSREGSFIVTSELEKSEKGIPYTQKIKFFYPEFLKDRVVYIDRDVEISTNQDMKYKFQQFLKTIPENSGLSKVLSPNTQVLGILLDEKNNSVIVDFSSHLVKEMNAGTSLESMLLKSIANTFGNYYQKDKVIITVEGKPYESGHVLMKPGEGFRVTRDNVQYGK